MRKSRSVLVKQIEREQVNLSTGEVITTKIGGVYKTRILEQFTMVRFTDDDKWIKELKPVLPLLLIMSQWIDATSNIVPLSTDRREYLCQFFELNNPRSLTTLLTQAIKLNGIVRVNGSVSSFMINPSFIYRGSTKEMPKKQTQYQNYRMAVKIIPNENFDNQ